MIRYDWQQETKHYITWYHCNEMWGHRWNYVPMINRVNNETFHLENHTNSGFILGYNEPNHIEQANVTGREAAAHWPEIESVAAGQKLVSPAASPCGGNCHGDALEWFDEFFHHCNGCRVDYIATHIYKCNATQVMDYLKQVYDRYGKKIWLTEFACPHTHSAARQLTFMKEVLPLLESAQYVFR